VAGAACAGDGLIVPADDAVWPRWQARAGLTVWHAASGPALSVTTMRLSLLGDYYPSLPWLAPGPAWQGGLRATGGLLPTRAGLTLPAAGRPATAWHTRVDEFQDDATIDVWPYIGVGYTGLSKRSGWGFIADVGIVAQLPRQANGRSRFGAGAQGLDDAVREIRLSPMVQLGVRYAF
jgi:hypothetical protein